MNVDIILGGLVTLVLGSKAHPDANPIQAVMAAHSGHTQLLMIKLSDLVLDGKSPDADYVVQHKDGPYGVWELHDKNELVSVVPSSTSTDHLKWTNCTDRLVDLQEFSPSPVDGVLDRLPQVLLERGTISCDDAHKTTAPWQFCLFGPSDKPIVGTCKTSAHKEYASEIKWAIDGVQGIQIGHKTLMFREPDGTGSRSTIGISNESKELKPDVSYVLRHYEAVWASVLGADPSKWLLPYNESLPQFGTTANTGKAEIKVKPSNPERCPGGIVYKKPN